MSRSSLVGWLICACLTGAPTVAIGEESPGRQTLADDLYVEPLRDGFWLFVFQIPGGFSSNGLVAPLEGGGVLLVDTPWDDARTELLVAWANEHLGGVRDAIVTHAHADSSGGVDALRRLGIRALGVDLSVAKAIAEGSPAPDTGFAASAGILEDARGFEVFYPGPGHTIDTVVVAFPATGVLYGGCLLKAGEAQGWGYIGEALLGDWSASVDRVEARYPQARTVIPGHGSVGGPETFARTRELVAAARRAEADAAGRVHADVPEAPDPSARWLFYLHGAIVEHQGRNAVSPDYGPYQYDAILRALADRGFEVVSEVRSPDSAFAKRLTEQVHRLRAAGVPAERITVVGASRGGGIALQAASRIAHPGVSFVLLAACGDHTQRIAGDLHGRVLSIRDASDRIDRSCLETFAAALQLTATHEIVVQLDLGHGLLYRPLADWLDPAEAWAKGTTLGFGH